MHPASSFYAGECLFIFFFFRTGSFESKPSSRGFFRRGLFDVGCSTCFLSFVSIDLPPGTF